MLSTLYVQFVRKKFQDLSDGLYDKIHLYSGVDFLTNDTEYAIPTRRWVLEIYYTWYKTVRKSLRCDVWDKKWDCDKFSTLFRILSSVCFLNDRPDTTAQSLAIGEVHYCIDGDPTKRHSINFAIVDKFELIFIEPQTGEVLELSDEELESIDAVIL